MAASGWWPSTCSAGEPPRFRSGKGWICSSSRQRTIARLPSFGMINDSDEELTLRGWIEIPYFALIFENTGPDQSLATVAIRSGTIPSLAQQNAAVTALPPNETA